MMDKNSIWKWLILFALIGGSFFVLRDGVPLGLDLQGGSSWTVQINRDQIIQDIRLETPGLSDDEVDAQASEILDGATERALEVIRNRVNPDGTRETIIYQGENNRITVQLPGIDKAERDRVEVEMKTPAFLEFRLVHENNDTLINEIFANGKAPEGYKIDNINGRPCFRRDKNVVINESDPVYRSKLHRFGAIPGYDFLLEKREVQQQVVYDPYFVKIRREMTGEYLSRATAGVDPMSGSVVHIWFDAEGKKKFANITSAYAPGGARNPSRDKYVYLAIVLDDVLHSAPRIKEAIWTGNAEISGSFTPKEARFLAKILSAGSLPAPIKIVEKRVVAPSLGEDSVRSGVKAVIYGGVGIILFMAFYYMVAGVIADIALLLNMMILPLGMVLAAGFLGIFSKDAVMGSVTKLPVLTLPGIAGILLTIGMAVDANVLIFERIREESDIGKRLWTSITAGYDRAFVTIIDANITTLLTGIVLFIFGSGPIRGFAVTLCAGIMVSMFTALVVTKLLFGVLVDKTTIKSLKMFSIIKKTAIDFVSFKTVAISLSCVLILATCGYTVVRGHARMGDVFGVDFLGGTSVTYDFTKGISPDEFEVKYPVQDLRVALESVGLKELHIQYQREMEVGGAGYLQIKTATDEIGGSKPSVVIDETLQKTFPEAAFVQIQEDLVGPQVGKELIRQAMWAISFALLMIIAYLSWRFEFGFAIGAIIALIHDVLVTVGIYVALGHQLSLPIVAALLTIVGYSVNDTIVVFDRIREDIRLIHNKDFKEIANLSINQTLSRTLLTSLTTLITVVMLLVFGGGAIHDFALALCIGVIVGTYSSIFIATPVVLKWYKGKKPEFASR